jgi:hypothetical protein
VYADGYDAFDVGNLENSECEPDDESEEFFLQYYAVSIIA